MIESFYKGKLIDELERMKPHGVHLRLEDKSESGIPDIATTFNGMTSWWEVKVGRPKLDLKRGGIQRLTCRRLAEQGHCWVIFVVEMGGKPLRTYVVTPAEAMSVNWDFSNLPSIGHYTVGLDANAIASFIVGIHDVKKN